MRTNICCHSVHMAKQKKWSTVVTCRDSDNDNLHVPQARSLHISHDGQRVVETPRSPQKQAAAPKPPLHYEWNPSHDYDHLDEDGYVFRETTDETPTTVPHVIGKVASKRYPTSVSPPRLFLQSSVLYHAARRPACHTAVNSQYSKIYGKQNLKYEST